VIWQGPDIPCIKLCSGDTISDVVFKLATELCTIMDQLKVSNYDLSCFNLAACPPEDFQALIQFLITKICELNGIPADDPKSSGCPDCEVGVATCLVENGQTTMQLIDYIQLIATKICALIAEIESINEQISVINFTLVDLQFQIDNLPVYELPSFKVDCILSGSNSLDVIVQTLMNDNASGYCSLLGSTGQPADINAAVLSQCITDIDQPLAALALSPPVISTFSAYYSGSWVNAVDLGASPTLANAVNNIWIAVCDIYNYLSNGFPTTVVDAGEGITVTSATVGLTTTYTVSTLGSLQLIKSPPANINITTPDWGGGRLCDGDIIVLTEIFNDFPGSYNSITGVWTVPATGFYDLNFFVSLAAPEETSPGASPNGWFKLPTQSGGPSYTYDANSGIIIAGITSDTDCDYYCVNNFTPTVISKYASISGSTQMNLASGDKLVLKVVNLTEINYMSTSGDIARWSITRIK
jgi:hypothetical protein